MVMLRVRVLPFLSELLVNHYHTKQRHCNRSKIRGFSLTMEYSSLECFTSASIVGCGQIKPVWPSLVYMASKQCQE